MNKSNKFFINLSTWMFLLVVNFSVVGFVYAESGNVSPPPTTGTQNQPVTISAKIQNPFKGGDDLMIFLTAIFDNIIMPIAAIAVTMWIIWAGFQYVLARGKPEALKTANLNLLWSLIGAGVLLGATAISKVVQTTVTSLMK